MTKTLTDPSIWIRRYHDAPPGSPLLVCFPHAGGSASFYHPVSGALRADVEVLAVQYPGRQDRRAEPQVTDIGTLADQVVEAFSGYGVTNPILFGHSMGAVVAYEVARRLAAEGLACRGLIVSGRRAPGRRRVERVHRRDDAGMIAEMRALSGTAASVLANAELMEIILPTMRGDYRAIETYEHVPGPRLTCPVTVFLSTADPQVTSEEASSWREYTDGEFALHRFEGGHFYLVERPAEVLERLGASVRALTA